MSHLPPPSPEEEEAECINISNNRRVMLINRKPSRQRVKVKLRERGAHASNWCDLRASQLLEVAVVEQCRGKARRSKKKQY